MSSFKTLKNKRRASSRTAARRAPPKKRIKRNRDQAEDEAAEEVKLGDSDPAPNTLIGAAPLPQISSLPEEKKDEEPEEPIKPVKTETKKPSA